MNDWISVRDRLPDVSGRYLVWCNGMVMTKEYSIKYRLFGAYDEMEPREVARFAAIYVTHWMPLPEPPNESKGQGVAEAMPIPPCVLKEWTKEQLLAYLNHLRDLNHFQEEKRLNHGE